MAGSCVLALAVSLAFGPRVSGRAESGESGQDAEPCAAFSTEMLRTRAAGGSAAAQRELADALSSGRCITQDLVEAARWYQASARRGNVDAQFRLGMMYLQGEGVSASPSRGAALLLKAANAGHALGQCAIGSLYASGRGVRRDNVQAYKWIKLSIRHGDERSIEALNTLSRAMTRNEIAAAERQAVEWKRRHDK